MTSSFDYVGLLLEDKVIDFHSINENGGNYTLICRNSENGLKIIRHTFAHVLGQALRRLYPCIQLGIGPATETGFYYDFLLDEFLSSNDFPQIKEMMYKIIDENIQIYKTMMHVNDLKQTLNDNLKNRIIDEKNTTHDFIQVYVQGDFIDPCKGPHVYKTGDVGKAFELTNISEITWKDVRLQRIEGVAFHDEEALNDFISNMQKKVDIDHRVLGPKLDLFSFSDLSPGFVFWHEKGLVFLNKMKKIIKKIAYQSETIYHEVLTPPMMKKELWEKTGHLPKYEENMFLLDDYALKPMNCPGHAILFKQSIKSYKHLPYRMSEIGGCFRNEDTGGLNGLKRCKHLSVDDGHIFCTMEQIQNEIEIFLLQAKQIYSIFNFKNINIKLSTRPEQYIGDLETWAVAERILYECIKDSPHIIAQGDGAFYGPKLELHLEDNMGRNWQCGTIQVDFFLAERLDAYYINDKSEKQYPVILHRAIAGSLERFSAIILEHYEGKLPIFLHPEPIAILPVTDDFLQYAEHISSYLSKKHITSMINNKNDSISKRIFYQIDLKTPIIMVIGEKEQQNQTVTFRINNDNYTCSIEEFITKFQWHI